MACTICGSIEHHGLFQCPVGKERLQVKMPWESPTNDFKQFTGVVMGMWNGGLEPEDRAPYNEKSENVNMGSTPSNLELGKKKAEELGLKRGPFNNSELYLADDIHRLLGEAPEYFGYDPSKPLHKHKECFCTVPANPEGYTHKALLIGIRPIVKQEPRILNVDEADKISMKVFGLNARQIDELRCFYEAQTGFRADLIGVTGPPESEERKLLRELVEWVGTYGIISYRGAFPPNTNAPLERAKRLLEGNK